MPDPELAPTVVIGTAGHIDHGKTSLLRALTGIDADRLPEEQARGMTIDVGYAHLAFEDGVELDFVDVPGHDRLIGNMLVGAGEIDAAMLVVAADDGPRPQTLEHLQLLDALGIADGLAVITKIDVVEAGRVDAVIAEVAVLLAGTSLRDATILAASSQTGEGIDALRIELRVLRDRMTPLLQRHGPTRLSVDRAFAVKGRGAVVTGTLRGGTLERGAALRREPGGEPIRIREIQVHSQPRDRHGGGRIALNIVGLPIEAIRRGDVLTTSAAPLAVCGADRLLVELRPSASLGPTKAPAVKRGARLRLHHGTDQVDVGMRLVRSRAGTALLALDQTAAIYPGATGVLREPASGAVVAGVRVLALDPPRGISRRRLTADRLERLVTAIALGHPVLVEAATTDVHGARSDGARFVFAPDVRLELESAAVEAVAAHHRVAALSAGLPLPRARAGLLKRLRSLATVERRDTGAAQVAIASLIDELVAEGRLARQGEALRDPARTAALPADLVAAMARLELALSVAAPPPLGDAAAAAGCPPEGIRALQADGRIVRLGPDLAWATPTYHGLAAAALKRARAAPLSPAAFRDATGTSRKYVLAILEDLDRRGILARTPDGHVPGPRAPGA